MPPMKGERSIVIQAPVQAVYDYISDFSRHIEWNHQPTQMTKLTDGPVGVGSVFRTKEQPASNAPWLMANLMVPLVGAIIGAKGYTEAEITAMEPARRLAWKARAPMRKGDFMRAEWEIVLDPEAERTKVTQHYHFMPQLKWMDNMANDKMSQSIGDEVAANLATLKAKLEGRPSHD